MTSVQARVVACLAAIATLALSVPIKLFAAERPSRVVSLNLCADQLLLQLAEPDQIKSLSPLARDRSLSFLAEAARAFPLNDGKGKSILFSGADLVLTGTFGQQNRTALLETTGLRCSAARAMAFSGSWPGTDPPGCSKAGPG